MMILCKVDRSYTQKVKKLVLGSNGTTQEVNRGIKVEDLISLSRFDWSCLIELNMCTYWLHQGNSKLGAKGCKYLSRASLPKLETLDLGFFISMQETTRSTAMECYIYARHRLDSSLNSTLVVFLIITGVNTIAAESVHWLLRLH